MRTVHVGPLTVLPGVAGLLAVLDVTVGLGAPALVVGAVLTLGLWLALERGLRREGMARVGSSRVDLQACKLEYSIVSPK